MSKEALKDFEDRVSHSLLQRSDLNCTISQVDLPPDCGDVWFVYLCGDKIYTAADKTLYVYLVSDTNSLIATYSLRNMCFSVLISENRLYLGEE